MTSTKLELSNMNHMTTTIRYNNIRHSKFMDLVIQAFPNTYPLCGHHSDISQSGFMKLAFRASPIEVIRAKEIKALITEPINLSNIEILNKYHIQLYDDEIAQPTILLIINNKTITQ